MFCPYCGKQIGDNQRFCQYCGGNIAQAQQSNAAAPQAPVQNPEPNPFAQPTQQQPVMNTPQQAQPVQQPENSFFSAAPTYTPPVSNPNPNPTPVYNQQQPQQPGYAQPNPQNYTQAQQPKKPAKDKARIEAENKRLYNEVLNRMRYYSSVKQYLDADEFFADRDA